MRPLRDRYLNGRSRGVLRVEVVCHGSWQVAPGRVQEGRGRFGALLTEEQGGRRAESTGQRTGPAAVRAESRADACGRLVVGTAQLPGNQLPDGWSDGEVWEAAPHDRIAGKAAIVALAAVALVCASTLWAHYRFVPVRIDACPLSTTGEVALLPDEMPYALPGSPGRIMVSSAMLASLLTAEQQALLAHERAYLSCRHHRLPLAAQLAGYAHPLLRPLRV